MAVCLPIWAALYVRQRAERTTQGLMGPTEAQALPLTAIVHLLLQASATLPARLGASPSGIQNGIVLYLAGAFVFTGFQALASRGMAHSPVFHQPVKAAFRITGTISAVVHVGIVLYGSMPSLNLNPSLSLARIYLPRPPGVLEQAQASRMPLTEAVHLFLQYDYIIVAVTVLVLGAHIMRNKTPDSKQHLHGSSSGSEWTLVVLTAIFGPGAGLAYACCHDGDDLVEPGSVQGRKHT